VKGVQVKSGATNSGLNRISRTEDKTLEDAKMMEDLSSTQEDSGIKPDFRSRNT